MTKLEFIESVKDFLSAMQDNYKSYFDTSSFYYQSFNPHFTDEFNNGADDFGLPRFHWDYPYAYNLDNENYVEYLPNQGDDEVLNAICSRFNFSYQDDIDLSNKEVMVFAGEFLEARNERIFQSYIQTIQNWLDDVKGQID